VERVARDQVQHLQPRVVGATAAHPGRHLLQTHMAVLLLHHPVGDRSALPGSARVSLSTGSQSPVGHPQETRKGKFEGGGGGPQYLRPPKELQSLCLSLYDPTGVPLPKPTKTRALPAVSTPEAARPQSGRKGAANAPFPGRGPDPC
jgi:hypothetical protein